MAPLPVITRHDWTRAEIQALLDQPLMDLLWQAQQVHRVANPGYEVQLASLLSVKTGGCEEDCAYCPQSMHHSSDVAGQPELDVAPVLARARAAKEAGAHRFCMGWAWREIRDGAPFDAMVEMVQGVRELVREPTGITVVFLQYLLPVVVAQIITLVALLAALVVERHQRMLPVIMLVALEMQGATARLKVLLGVTQ